MSIQRPVYGGEFPFPPSVNTLTAVVRGRKIKSKKGREFAAKVVELCREYGMAGLNLSADISMHLTLYLPDRRRRDSSNYIKALEDAFTEAGVWLDDEQVVHHTIIKVRKTDDKQKGEAIVSIVEISG